MAPIDMVAARREIMDRAMQAVAMRQGNVVLGQAVMS